MLCCCGGSPPDPKSVETSSPSSDLSQFENGRYSVLTIIGKGAYSVVLSATDNITKETVAIKQLLPDTLDNAADALAVLLELRVLAHCKHENVISVKDAFMSPNCQALYLVLPLLPSDLAAVSKTAWFTDARMTTLIFQVLCGLLYMHGCKIVHRDINPNNILVDTSSTCAKLCDFNLASVLTPEGVCAEDRWYVVHRWYRAPELVLGQTKHGTAVDIWSCGCTIAQMLRPDKQPLFRGSSNLRQLDAISAVLGTPSEAVVSKISDSEKVRRYAKTLAFHSPLDLKTFLQTPQGKPVDPSLIEMVSSMLQYVPGERVTVRDALNNPYFRTVSSATGRPNANDMGGPPFKHDVIENIEGIQQGLREEIRRVKETKTIMNIQTAHLRPNAPNAVPPSPSTPNATPALMSPRLSANNQAKKKW